MKFFGFSCTNLISNDLSLLPACAVMVKYLLLCVFLINFLFYKLFLFYYESFQKEFQSYL
jgi:hypothetical protein